MLDEHGPAEEPAQDDGDGITLEQMRALSFGQILDHMDSSDEPVLMWLAEPKIPEKDAMFAGVIVLKGDQARQYAELLKDAMYREAMRQDRARRKAKRRAEADKNLLPGEDIHFKAAKRELRGRK